jgi:2-oxoglutarate dehydrogenase E1 component
MSSTLTTVFNDGYIAEVYEAYQRDPTSVDESWRQYFRTAAQFGGGAGSGPTLDASTLRAAAGASALVAAIRRFGHLDVQIDPLGTQPQGAPELTPEYHGITERDLTLVPGAALGFDSFKTATDVVAHLRQLYSGGMGFEFIHVNDAEERAWFRQMIESGKASTPLTADEKKQLLSRLTHVDGLERFLGRAYVSVKRFSIEGIDAIVPMLDEAIRCAGHEGATSAVIGMAHRGRLNVLVHVMGKPYRTLLEEFEGHHLDTNAVSETGDVKYHMGYRTTCEIDGVGAVDIELAPNPSHLEFVNPVMMGMARARQRADASAGRERDESRVLPILIHGDASFPGEGVVSETLNLSLLRGYRVGGTLHIIGNNQVGFTTDPIDARSTHYASDMAKGFEIPVVHVNGDDLEACVQAIRLSIAYRKRFGKDFLIDVVGYRRHGHNEADQPGFTQPTLYAAISKHQSPREVWGARLVREGVVTAEQVAAEDRDFAQELQSAYETMKRELAEAKPSHDEGGDFEGAPPHPPIETAVRAERLVQLNEQLLTWPSDFTLHPTIQRTLPRRRDALHNAAIDWGHAEALAFASLLTEGVGIRLTGQDVERGTFSHRHVVLHDVGTGGTYAPLANLPGKRAPFEVYNSPLSETAVMGFEYGFSTATSDLVLWEAQFGDFANVAQPIVDQFIVADRAKWGQDSRLALLLPHGYEGQGPEHSSARLERFLQLFAEGNLTVAYPSSPAQYFHILRRQALRALRRPLVLMQPKSLLRLPAAASSIEQLASGSFQCVIDDPSMAREGAREQVKRLVFCTGKLYYDLSEAERPANVAVVRVEELAPWPREVGDVVDRYPNVDEVVWAQEEPKNMGAWTYVQPRLRASIGTLPVLKYIGRPERASPAEGYKDWHDQEQKRIVDAVLTVPAGAKKKVAANRS